MNLSFPENNFYRDFMKGLLMWCYVYCAPVPLRNWQFERLGRSLITVLTYHRVDNDPQDVNAVSVKNFDRQMAFLKSNYQVITVETLLNDIKIGSSEQRKIVITFDDGYLDNYQNAAPILQKYDLPACFFITSGRVGTDKAFDHDLKRLGRKVAVMTWDHVSQLKQMGFEIGAHTINHVRLSQCEGNDLTKEIYGAKKTIEEKIGSQVNYFSHPHGLRTDTSPAAVSEMKRAGFLCNFSAYGGLVRPEQVDLYDIKRVGIPNHKSVLFFRAWLEGWRTQN